MKRSSIAILSKLLGIAIAIWLVRLVGLRSGADMRAEFRECDPDFLVLAFFLFGTGIAISSFRWTKLLEVQGVVLTTWQAVRLTMIGVFFNVVVPGGVGGDFLKMAYVRRHAGTKTPEAILSILVDRIVGLLGLFMIAILSVIFNWKFLMSSSEQIRSTVITVFVVAILGFVAVGVAMFNDLFMRIPPVGALFGAMARKGPQKLVNLVSRVVRGLVLYRNHLGVLAGSLAISMVVHTCTALAVWGIGRSFHAVALRVGDYFLAVQIANTISAVPITPGGLGARDVILATFFHAVGEGSKTGVITTVNSMIVVLWSLIGGVFYFLEARFHAAEMKAALADGEGASAP